MTEDCPICLQEIAKATENCLITRCCKKDIHQKCIEKWTGKCPMCRGDYVEGLVTYDESQLYNNTTSYGYYPHNNNTSNLSYNTTSNILGPYNTNTTSNILGPYGDGTALVTSIVHVILRIFP